MLRTIRSWLILLVALSLLPFGAVAILAGWRTHEARSEAQLTANLELARSSASTLEVWTEDVLHSSGVAGRAIAEGQLGPERASKLLQSTAVDYSAVRDLSWVAMDGRVLSSSNPRMVGLSFTSRDWFGRLVALELETMITDLYPAVLDGEPIFVVARTIRLGDRPAGVVVAAIDPERLGALTFQAREGEGAIAVFDRSGQLVFRNPPLQLRWDERRNAGPSLRIVREALGGREATGTFRSETGDDRLGAAVPVHTSGWVVRAGRPIAEVNGPLRAEIALTALVAILSALAALIASTRVGRRINAALARLQGHAEALGRGERPAALSTGPVEIRRLGAAYEQMAAHLLASQQRFQAVFDAAPTGIVVLEPTELRARWANRACLAFLDEPFRSAGIEGRRVEEFLPGAAEVGLPSAFRRVADGLAPQLEAQYRHDAGARGRTSWHWSLRPIPAEGGGRELLLVLSDVTQEVAARERVEAHKRRLEAVLKTLPVGVFIADTGGQLVKVNDEAKRIWGGDAPRDRSFRAYRGRWADSGVPLESKDWGLSRALERGESSSGELIEIERFDGTRGTILGNAVPIRDESGRITGAVSAIQDVTELRRAIRHRDEVLQVVSHDLRTPLGAVILGAATLASLPDDTGAVDRTRRVAGRIAAAGRRMSRLIDDLLDFTGLEEGRLSIRRSACDPVDLLGEAADQIGEAAKEKGLDVCLSIAPGLPEVECDRDRILQVFGNVASNAVKATEQGCICLAAEPRGDGEVVFRVRDTGPGIPEEELPLVFDRFKRGAETTYQGSGLGLSIARGLVEAQGGEIWAESTPGEGTTVSFTVPAARPEEHGAVAGAA
jgi:signal transduction histidine kinase